MSALLKHTQTTDIEDREKIIMTGVLSLKAKKIRDVMTNLIDVFMLDVNRIVDDELVLNIHGYGYSRIPVYEGRRCVRAYRRMQKETNQRRCFSLQG